MSTLIILIVGGLGSLIGDFWGRRPSAWLRRPVRTQPRLLDVLAGSGPDCDGACCAAASCGGLEAASRLLSRRSGDIP